MGGSIEIWRVVSHAKKTSNAITAQVKTMVSLIEINPHLQKMVSSGLICTSILSQLLVFLMTQTISQRQFRQNEARQAKDKPVPAIFGNEVKARDADRRPSQETG
jgi:hypothetical protein